MENDMLLHSILTQLIDQIQNINLAMLTLSFSVMFLFLLLVGLHIKLKNRVDRLEKGETDGLD